MSYRGFRSLLAGCTAINGAMVGAIFGPVGAVVGAAAGGIGSMLFTESVESEDPKADNLTNRAKDDESCKYFSCFISYSTRDEEFAKQLYADLQNSGVSCWFAPYDVIAGKKLHEQIDEAIGAYDRLVVVLSSHSMRSEWVKTEIAKARKRELCEGRQILFPLRLVEFQALSDWEFFDADIGKDSAREIREYFVPDFSGWKNPNEYKVAFDRLLLGLRQKTS